MWIGVRGGVYDVTDFLPMHPGGTLIVAASAGLDATKTFHELAHDVSTRFAKRNIMLNFTDKPRSFLASEQVLHWPHVNKTRFPLD